MKKRYPLLLLFLLTTSFLNAQTTLYSENFETGGGSFTLNTTDLGGTSTPNFWIINNVYTGGNGSLMCLGFPFSYTINNTPTQPAAITNSPTSTYLHTLSIYGQADNIFCSSYAAADGICILNSTNFCKMNTGINTVGYDSVAFNFWWNCSGGTNIYGEVLYSTNGGTSWNTLTNPISQYKNQSNWVSQTIYNSTFDNQPDQRFAYRFVNNTSNSALDPGFSIDDIIVTGQVSAPLVDTDSLAQLEYCQGDSIQVCYTVSGASFAPGNTFILELSNASGGFSGPDTLATVVDTASGCMWGIIPANQAPGTAYRVRIVATDPTASLGTNNGQDITIASPPSTGAVAINPDTICQSSSVSLTAGNPSGTSYQWRRSTDGINFTDIPGGNAANYTDSPVTQTTFYYLVAYGGACEPDTSEVLEVYAASPPTANFTWQAPTPGLTATFTDQSLDASSYTWDFGDGMGTSTQANPTYTYNTAGTYVVCLTATNACGSNQFCDTIDIVCPLPTATFSDSIVQSTVFFTDLSSGLGIYQWDWDFGDGNSSSSQNPTYTYPTDDTYTVCLTVTDSCGSVTSCDTLTVPGATGVGAEAIWEGLEVFPNPFSDELQFVFSGQANGKLELSLVNPLGQTTVDLYLGYLQPGVFAFTWAVTPNLPEGVYFLRMQWEDRVGYRKLVLRR